MMQHRAVADGSQAEFWVRAALWALFVFSREAILFYLCGRGTDLGIHRDYVAQVLSGRVPYRDFFPEYPPLVFAFTALPAIVDHSLRFYFPLFRALCCVVDCGIWIVVLRLTRRQPSQALLYILCTTALGNLLYDRIDVVLGLVLLAAVVFMLAGRDKLGYLAVGVGIAFKFIPVVWVPALLAYAWRKGAARAAVAFLLLALPTIISFDAAAAFGGYQFSTLFDYHSRRGIQIESVPASAEMLMVRLGTPGVVSFEYGSFNLHTLYEGLLTHASTALLAATMLGASLLVLKRGATRDSLAVLLAAILTAALLFSKVLSPQFFIFLLPVLVVLPSPRGRCAAAAAWTLTALLYLLTGLIYPWNYDSLTSLEWRGEVLLWARNAVLVIMTLYLTVRAWRVPLNSPEAARLDDLSNGRRALQPG